MGLLILTALGAIFGWLAAIVLACEDRGGLLCNAGAGVTGAIVGGLAANSASVLQGLSGAALLVAIVGALVCIALANVMRARI